MTWRLDQNGPQPSWPGFGCHDVRKFAASGPLAAKGSRMNQGEIPKKGRCRMCRRTYFWAALLGSFCVAGVLRAADEGQPDRKPEKGLAATAAEPAATAQKVDDNKWRMRWHNGRWWYWLPNERWVWWTGSMWTAQEPAVVGTVPSQSNYSNNGVRRGGIPSNELWIRPDFDVYPNRD
jgi:hypothetical protein